jgi:hypothetical protein
MVLAATASGCAGRKLISEAPARPTPPAIRLASDPESELFGTVSLVGLRRDALARFRNETLVDWQWASLFPIYTGGLPAPDEARQPVVGDYIIEAEAIRFRPRFPFTPGMTYGGAFDGPLFDGLSGQAGAGTPVHRTTFTMPVPEIVATTVVEAVYPSGDGVPENLLRLYIHFSAPIGLQAIHEHIHLYEEDGAEVSLPFVEIEEGLWDPERRRLTLFFHPGRIKRGVALNAEQGLPLREGGSYRLVIDERLQDADGLPLASQYEKVLHAGRADRISPDHRDWRVHTPATRHEPLVVDFPEPLDRALLLRWVIVEDTEGNAIEGEVTLSRGETRWTFAPAEEWAPGDYLIYVNPALEDLAGNTFLHLFDEEGGMPGGDPAPDAEALSLPFTVK